MHCRKKSTPGGARRPPTTADRPLMTANRPMPDHRTRRSYSYSHSYSYSCSGFGPRVSRRDRASDGVPGLCDTGPGLYRPKPKERESKKSTPSTKSTAFARIRLRAQPRTRWAGGVRSSVVSGRWSASTVSRSAAGSRTRPPGEGRRKAIRRPGATVP
jgi:hypothetical protein